jgi:hypothetical protein
MAANRRKDKVSGYPHFCPSYECRAYLRFCNQDFILNYLYGSLLFAKPAFSSLNKLSDFLGKAFYVIGLMPNIC